LSKNQFFGKMIAINLYSKIGIQIRQKSAGFSHIARDIFC